LKSGKVAGTTHLGYVKIRINGKQYRAHRLAWLYIYGAFPSIDIDHINTVKSDNRIVNLRLAHDHENLKNIGLVKTNTSGFRGVHKARSKWQATASLNGDRIYLGRYDTPEAASEVYETFAKQHHGEFYRAPVGIYYSAE
jgi:hypothetical protein